MKKILFAAFLVISGFGTMAAARSINEKLVQIFRQTYPDAVDVSWLEYPETYAVSFKEGDERSIIIFSKDGTFLRATRYYDEKYLPYYLVAAIHGKYPAKKIYGVIEVSTPENIDYFIKLEDAKTWMTIQVSSDGSIKAIENFKKA